MELKSPNGYYSMALSDVVSLTITVRNDEKPTSDSTTRTFFSPDSGEILRQLKLNVPSEPGYPASMTTGILTIQLKNGDARQFEIQNETLLEDKDHPETIYQPKEKLDFAWLKGLE